MMKRLFSMLMAAVMLVCGACAFAEGADSIVGQWFVSYVLVSEGVVSAPGDAGFAQDVVINEDGTCAFNMSDYNGNSSSVAGVWSQNDSGMYELEFESGTAMLVQIIGEELVACDSDGNTYHCVSDINDTQKLIAFNGYSKDAVDSAFFGDWVCEAMLFAAEDGSRQYYSRHILGLDFAVSISLNEELGGYSTDWHIGGVGAEVYNEDVQTVGGYGADEAGDMMMYTNLTLSNGISTQVFIYMDSSLETMHVYGIYGTLVFVKAENAQERPAAITEAYNQ